MPKRVQRITALIACIGVAVCLLTVIFAWDEIVEGWYLRKLAEEDLDVQLEAIDRLAELGSEELVPRLVEMIRERDGATELGCLRYVQQMGLSGLDEFTLSEVRLTPLAYRLFELCSSTEVTDSTPPGGWRGQASLALSDEPAAVDPPAFSNRPSDPRNTVLRCVLEGWADIDRLNRPYQIVTRSSFEEVQKALRQGPITMMAW